MNRIKSEKDSFGYKLKRIELKVRNFLIEVAREAEGHRLVLPLPDDPDEDKELTRLNRLLYNCESGKPSLLQEGTYEVYPETIETGADWIPADRKLMRIEQKTGRQIIGTTPFIDKKTGRPVPECVNVLLSISVASSGSNHSRPKPPRSHRR